MNSPEKLMEKFTKLGCENVAVAYKVTSGKKENMIVATVSCIYHGKNMSVKGEGKNNYVAASAAFDVLRGKIAEVKGKNSPKGRRKPNVPEETNEL